VRKKEKSTLKKTWKIKRFVGCFDDSAIIIGIALYEQFDFENLKFEKPVLVVYIVGNALPPLFKENLPL
jgi:hypothetical protein